MRPGLLSYLTAVQEADACSGLSGFCRSRRGVPHERTIYRWHHRLGSSLVVTPVFAVESLGLSHVHAFLTGPSSAWEEFPYVVEYAWVTPDCTTRVLYLHCVVPCAHEAVVLGMLGAISRRGGVEVVRSGTGWERLLPCPGWTVPSMGRGRAGVAVRLLREVPLVVPAIFEGWGVTLSLDKTWRRIKDRLGSSVRSYVPRGRCYVTNGKRHVRNAYAALSEEGLFVQYAVHYRPRPTDDVEAFVRCESKRAAAFVAGVRAECSMLAVHPGAEECLFHVAGSARLLDVLMNAGIRRLYWVNRRATDACGVRVRFAYERLFDPKHGEWLLPEARD